MNKPRVRLRQVQVKGMMASEMVGTSLPCHVCMCGEGADDWILEFKHTAPQSCLGSQHAIHGVLPTVMLSEPMSKLVF